jgi:signal transduction histidine kinase
MAELRQVLGVLRDGDGVTSTPLPTLADLPELVQAEPDVGVSLCVDGDIATVPGSIGLATYRIVQEALTNSRRHGGPGVAVSVRIACAPGCVEVMVDDDGRGASSAGPAATDDGGYGLIGMRERAVAAGGDLHAGPKTGGGWRVRARLPFAPCDETSAPPVTA